MRVLHGLAALALASFVLVQYWPVLETFDLYRADLGYQGKWLEGHTRQITTVAPGAAAARAGLKPGDVLEFDPNRDEDWVLASYRHMPEGFTGTVHVRRPDGTRSLATLAPARVAYLPTLADRVALVVRLCGMTLMMAFAVFLIWARPSLMTWSLYVGTVLGGAPFRTWIPHYFAFEAEPGFNVVAFLVASFWTCTIALIPFGLSFPRDTIPGLSLWQRALGAAVALAVTLYMTTSLYPEPFVTSLDGGRAVVLFNVLALVSVLVADVALGITYRRSSREDQSRLKWALVGISVTFLAFVVSFTVVVIRSAGSDVLSGSVMTPHNWVATLAWGVGMLSIGYALLRQRVIDVQFAISRTVVYGIVSTIVLVFLALLDWLLGRMIEHSRLAFGLEGIAAVGLGLVLHRASHGINTGVDRVLFRKHHAAEQRLRQVTAALPFASSERGIAEAIVAEPARNLEFASAALFFREKAEGPLERVMAVGWSDSHPTELDAESLLARYLQAEHGALRLDGEQLWLPDGMPQGAAHPVLAIPSSRSTRSRRWCSTART